MSKLVIQVAYRGREKRVVWTPDVSGRMHGKEYYEKLADKERGAFFALFRWMGDVGEIRNEEKFRHEEDGIYVFKTKRHRLLCFLDGRDVVVTHGIKKQKGKLHRKELQRSQRIRRHYYGMKASESEEG